SLHHESEYYAIPIFLHSVCSRLTKHVYLFQFIKLYKNFDIIGTEYCKRFFDMQQFIQRQGCQIYDNVF
ncbi:hypothetical protein PN594_19515, partial [Parabacteroides merdae]|nr:hypothetical protein [Parabacteroides merdae]